mgnify:CR=1 FL=1
MKDIIWRNMKELWRINEEIWRKFEGYMKKYEGNMEKYEGNMKEYVGNMKIKILPIYGPWTWKKLGIFPSPRARIEGYSSEFFQVPIEAHRKAQNFFLSPTDIFSKGNFPNVTSSGGRGSQNTSWGGVGENKNMKHVKNSVLPSYIRPWHLEKFRVLPLHIGCGTWKNFEVSRRVVLACWM